MNSMMMSCPICGQDCIVTDGVFAPHTKTGGGTRRDKPFCLQGGTPQRGRAGTLHEADEALLGRLERLAADPAGAQRLVECGSHQCGENTSAGLYEVVPGIKAVMLNNHGPNICFSRQASPADVIAFIESRFDLADKTGGPVA